MKLLPRTDSYWVSRKGILSCCARILYYFTPHSFFSLLILRMKSATFSYYSVTYLCLCFFGFIIVSVHEQEFKCGVKPRENQGNSPFTPGAKYKIYNTKSKKTNKIKCMAARNNQDMVLERAAEIEPRLLPACVFSQDPTSVYCYPTNATTERSWRTFK